VINQLRYLVSACKQLSISYSFIDNHQNLIKINTLPNATYFINYTTPLNTSDVVRICSDKDFTIQLLKSVILTPKTKSYLDPSCPEKYRHYLKHRTPEEICNDILLNFSLPLILKKNSGSQGSNVFLCHTRKEIKSAAKTIFDQKSKEYDYILLAQEYIHPKTEYRVVVCRQQITFAYQKDISQALFTGNLSPLHWHNAKALLCSDTKLLTKFQNFLSPIYSLLPLSFGGIDIIEDQNNNLWLIEINTNPGFDYFLRDNSPKPLIDTYKRILSGLIPTTHTKDLQCKSK
jgi:glutathione synthase/RimK-type ligase-like ATP-grasp enzyme